MIWLITLIALAAGAANPFQSGTNAELNKQLGQPVVTGIIVYATGLAALLLVQIVMHKPLPSLSQIHQAHWWAWVGGIVSLVSTIAGLTLAQKLGSGLFTGLTITASIVVSVALDHFGLIGFRQHTASPARLAGCGLMIAGIWLVSRF
jgi:transporter family-2 protein